jgi:hypothetical protein
MASFYDIDLSKPLSIEPHVMTQLTDPDMVALAHSMHEPNLLKCDTPIGQGVTLAPDAASAFMEWLLQSRWRPILESDLQCIAETAAGEPLLTTWLHIDSLKVLVDDAKHIEALQPVRAALDSWAGQGVGNVYIEGHELRRNARHVQPISDAEELVHCLADAPDRRIVELQTTGDVSIYAVVIEVDNFDPKIIATVVADTPASALLEQATTVAGFGADPSRADRTAWRTLPVRCGPWPSTWTHPQHPEACTDFGVEQGDRHWLYGWAARFKAARAGVTSAAQDER